MTGWLAVLYDLNDADRIDDTIDAVYDHFLPLLELGDLAQISKVMSIVEIERLGVEAVLAFLAITVPASRQIAGRDSFFRRAHAHLVALRGEIDAARLLDGLA